MRARGSWRTLGLASLLAGSVALPDARAAEPTAGTCGEVVRIAAHDGHTTRYAQVLPADFAARSPRVAFVLLPGGGGHLDLDPSGCPRRLRGNSLVRSLPLFHAAGIATALVDAPSSHHGPDGLAGFRIDERHAHDLGCVIELETIQGVPLVHARSTVGSHRMFFDTGAQLSCFNHPSLDSGKPAGEVRDFHPLIGEFHTPTYRVPFRIGSADISLRCGRLPERLCATLGLAGAEGIIGNESCVGRKVGYSARRRQLVLG